MTTEQASADLKKLEQEHLIAENVRRWKEENQAYEEKQLARRDIDALKREMAAVRRHFAVACEELEQLTGKSRHSWYVEIMVKANGRKT